MEKLPIELMIHIFQTAAYMFRSTERGTVVKLALTASFVYDTIAPILYERLVVTHRNQGAVSMLAQTGAVSFLEHVRFLWTGPDRIGIPRSVAELLLRATAVYGSMDVWDEIAAVQARAGVAIASDVHLWNVDLPVDLKEIQKSHLRSLTRVHSFIPQSGHDSMFSDFSRDAAGWTHHLLELLPSLTALGFSHVNPISEDQVEDAYSKDLEAFETIIRTVKATREPCVQVVALRITGEAAAWLDAYIRIVRDMDDDWAMQHMRIWVDKRDIFDWSAEVRLVGEDANKERSIWTEAKQLDWYREASCKPTLETGI
ncbi:hypothetical protein BKA62DRAFT_721143 [Auriculariales sp. MPI-PUGE-AT-0066]|nr:hypothetical protein BKA62DRAFT_721143 [Auriculariales sp. MPI-PUGE-AT-0066]